MENSLAKAAFAAVLLASAAFSAEPPPAPVPDADAAAPALPAAQAPRRPRGLPPEAFTEPSNFLYVVDVVRDGVPAADFDWLVAETAGMRRSLQVGVKAVRYEAGDSFDPRAAAKSILAGEHADAPEARLVVFVDSAPDIPPVVASPYEGWAAMDAGWVARAGGGEETVRERTGKRLWQTLGALCGAAYRPEREAVMRYCPTPESLDDCLSHNFHPLNSNSFATVARAVGLDRIRLRPRAELEALGIVKPRPPRPGKKPDAAAEGGDKPEAPAAPAEPAAE
ncbi:MAG: hypothetical protein IJ783_08030 [Kiritimatiellae bacterium]|nr:hypothetical protein [Kiritimatiellia bacterium]